MSSTSVASQPQPGQQLANFVATCGVNFVAVKVWQVEQMQPAVKVPTGEQVNDWTRSLDACGPGRTLRNKLRLLRKLVYKHPVGLAIMSKVFHKRREVLFKALTVNQRRLELQLKKTKKVVAQISKAKAMAEESLLEGGNLPRAMAAMLNHDAYHMAGPHDEEAIAETVSLLRAHRL